MSELDLDAIRERAGYRSAAGFASPDGRAADIDSADDVPALLAEIERLRAGMDFARAKLVAWQRRASRISPSQHASAINSVLRDLSTALVDSDQS